MKAKIYLTLFFSITILISIAQTTNQSGNWVDPIWNGGNPGLDLQGDVTVESGHNVHIGEIGDQEVLSLVAKNGGTLLIKGILTINGSITVSGKKWNIVVADGAELIITQDVNFTQQQGGDNMPELNITGTGTVTINGNVNSTGGGGTITGDGTMNVDGDIIGDINIYDDVTVVGNPDTFCPPSNLRGSIDLNGEGYKVMLEWEIIAGCSPIEFEIKRTLGEVVEIFIHGNTKSTTYSWIDTKDLTGNSEPVYEVKAIYVSQDGQVYNSTSTVLSYENNPLPIELLHFSAKAEQNQVQVEWATAAEINNDFFTLERSTNGQNWETITYIQGAGTANYTINYNFTDQNPLQGVSYYRLKQTDFDGQFEYFAPVAVHTQDAATSTEIVNVAFNGSAIHIGFKNENPNAVLLVADIQGRIIGQFNAEAADYVQNITVNLSRNYTGEMVMVRLLSNDKSDEKKFIVR